MAPEAIAAVVVVAALDTWVGVAGLVASGIGALTAAAASALYARRLRSDRDAVTGVHDNGEHLERHLDRSVEELSEAVESLWRQREVLTQALKESEPGTTSIALAEQVGSLDRQFVLLKRELWHARASPYGDGAETAADVSRVRPRGDT